MDDKFESKLLDKEYRFAEVNVDQDRALNRLSQATCVSVKGDYCILIENVQFVRDECLFHLMQ